MEKKRKTPKLEDRLSNLDGETRKGEDGAIGKKMEVATKDHKDKRRANKRKEAMRHFLGDEPRAAVTSGGLSSIRDERRNVERRRESSTPPIVCWLIMVGVILGGQGGGRMPRWSLLITEMRKV